MSLAESIAGHLPQLRRFARLLTGTQRDGDNLVGQVLECLVADPAAFPALPARVGLYKFLLQILGERETGSKAQTDALGKTASRSLSALSPRARRAFLLASVEGFAPNEASLILDVPESKIEELLKEAGEQIGRQIATDVLIIEDEPMIAIDLQRVLQELGHRVTSIARTHKDAIRAASAQRPGLVLADIRLADGSSGLDAVNDLLTSFSVPVVFVTAYPERLMTGERPEPTFLITKPFRDDAVKAIVSQVLFFDQQAEKRS
jgi:DNA-directed RNA polymerase specialized sigma24 family protein